MFVLLGFHWKPNNFGFIDMTFLPAWGTFSAVILLHAGKARPLEYSITTAFTALYMFRW